MDYDTREFNEDYAGKGPWFLIAAAGVVIIFVLFG